MNAITEKCIFQNFVLNFRMALLIDKFCRYDVGTMVLFLLYLNFFITIQIFFDDFI